MEDQARNSHDCIWLCGASRSFMVPVTTGSADASDIELIGIDQIDEAYERILRSDVRYRFVIEMASLTGANRAGN